ncbi:putative metalloprotease CJM1_0395 family protein [Colwellia asteriadis]|uniref:Metalloprotease CJM1_0395 family protein n=1 Tax=Colwellia asteriadis TaxID=517723 RepID=A0ABP3WJW8_9GAMM
MNIAPSAPTLSTPTVVNPPTETLRRENNRREVITQVASANPSAAEKGVASDKDRAKTPAQNNEQFDFANLRKQAELAAGKVSEKGGEQSEQNPDEKDQEQQAAAAKQEDKKIADDIEAEAAADEKVIRQLASRDQEVRAHENAHASVGGATTGAPSYSFDVGPDGKKYAVSGEVSVDLSVVSGNPQATIKKMQQVHAAALAPANPSAQDIRVAANATKIILEAQSELLNSQPDGSSSNNHKNDINIANNTLKSESQVTNQNNDFDELINQTLNAQETIAPSKATLNSNANIGTQTIEVQQRAQRVESFYHTVSQGYERPDSHHFELTA